MVKILDLQENLIRQQQNENVAFLQQRSESSVVLFHKYTVRNRASNEPLQSLKLYDHEEGSFTKTFTLKTLLSGHQPTVSRCEIGMQMQRVR